MNINKQTVLITGGASGIGLALVRQFAAEECQVIVVSRNAQQQTFDALGLKSVKAYQCDLCDRDAIKKLVEQLLDDEVEINLVINNAGVQFTPTLVSPEFDLDLVEREVTTNFTSVVWLTSYLLPYLSRGSKSSAIVNISSGLAIYPKTSSAVYCATKAALHSFSQSLRYQLEGGLISVHEVVLPLVDTAMTRGRGKNKISPEQAAASILAGLKNGKEEIYVGKARLLPWLARVAPGIAKGILKKY